MTVIYIQTNNEELYLYNNDVKCYIITCKSAFDWVYANNGTKLPVDTRFTYNLLEAGCTNKLCPFQYNILGPVWIMHHHIWKRTGSTICLACFVQR